MIRFVNRRRLRVALLGAVVLNAVFAAALVQNRKSSPAAPETAAFVTADVAADFPRRVDARAATTPPDTFPRYRITPLPAGFTPSDISDAGAVSGSWETGRMGRAGHPEIRAAIWAAGRLRVLPGRGRHDQQTYGLCVNRAGVIGGMAGTSENVENGSDCFRAALWNPNGGYQDLGALPGRSNARVLGVNSAGQAVGHAGAAGWWEYPMDVKPHGLLFDRGRVLDLGECYPEGINDCGQIVGNAGYQAVVWETRGGGAPRRRDIGPGEAAAINGRGDVAGSLETDADGVRKSGFAYLGDEGVYHLLGTLGFAGRSQAADINDRRQVVGSLFIFGDRDVALLWQDDITCDLNRLVTGGADWRLEDAVAINNRGQVVGIGQFRGKTRPFLLIPVGR